MQFFNDSGLPTLLRFGIVCIASLLSKERGLKVQVSVIYCISDIRYVQDAKALVSRGDVMLLSSVGHRLNRGLGVLQ